MQANRFRKPFLTSVLVFGCLILNCSAADSRDLTSLLNEKEAALVTVKYVLNVNMGGGRANQETETENELTCSMISSDGLVVCSNSQLGGFISMIARMAGPRGKNMSATPKNLQVILGANEQSFDAEIIAIDSELDIVWIRVTDPGDTSFSFIDFSQSTNTNLGDSTILIRRTSGNFGRTPVLSRSHIGGITEKPRKLYILESSSNNGAGLPVFAVDGRVIGLMVTQLPEAGEAQGNPMGMLGNMSNLQDAMSGLILPAAEVLKATERAMETPEPE